MMCINNPQKEELFQDKWKEETGRMNRKQHKGQEILVTPGPGWLGGIAAHYDLCAAVFRNAGGTYSVCGRKLSEHPSDDPYYCSVCVELKEKLARLREQGT